MYRLQKKVIDIEAVEDQKRFYTRGTLRSIGASRLAEILELRNGELFELHRMEGGLKDIHCSAQKKRPYIRSKEKKIDN